jgi:hypothetical protein
VERRKAWRMLQSKAGIENKEYQAQRAILADVDTGKISREDFFARAVELLKARLDLAAEETPRPMTQPTPAVPAKTPALVSETVSKSRERETSEVVVAAVTKVAMENESDESASWEQRIQLRLMELDVDPGNDAGGGLSKHAGN